MPQNRHSGRATCSKARSGIQEIFRIRISESRLAPCFPGLNWDDELGHSPYVDGPFKRMYESGAYFLLGSRCILSKYSFFEKNALWSMSISSRVQTFEA